MRLIDADALAKEIAGRIEESEENMEFGQVEGLEGAWCCVDNAPTIDAVPVVRCKDCIYWWESHKMCKRNKDKNHHCACMNCDADFFCKNGERRTDEAD